ncbi:hypothetical protein ACFLY6_03475 [Candidatus Dependentiae bacterium]
MKVSLISLLPVLCIANALAEKADIVQSKLESTKEIFISDPVEEKKTFRNRTIRLIGHLGKSTPHILGLFVGVFVAISAYGGAIPNIDGGSMVQARFCAFVAYAAFLALSKPLINIPINILKKIQPIPGFNWINTCEKVDANTIREAIEDLDEIKEDLLPAVAKLLENERLKLVVTDKRSKEKTSSTSTKQEITKTNGKSIKVDVDDRTDDVVEPEKPQVKLKRLPHTKALEVMKKILKIIDFYEISNLHKAATC